MQPDTTRPAAATGATVPVIEETLSVTRERIDAGGWRLVKQVRGEAQTVDEVLTDHTVHIERRPVGRYVDAAPAARQDGQTLIVPVLEEVLVTEKRLLLVEEVHITQLATARRHTESVVLRKEDIQIERLDAEGSSENEPS